MRISILLSEIIPQEIIGTNTTFTLIIEVTQNYYYDMIKKLYIFLCNIKLISNVFGTGTPIKLQTMCVYTLQIRAVQSMTVHSSMEFCVHVILVCNTAKRLNASQLS